MFGLIYLRCQCFWPWCHLQSYVQLPFFFFFFSTTHIGIFTFTWPGLLVWLYSVLFVRHTKDWRAGWRSVGWVRRPHWTTPCLSAQSSCDSGRILWYKAASLRSLCSHTRDALYFSPRVGWRGWVRVGGASGGGGGGGGLEGLWLCWQLAVWTAIAVLKLLWPLGEVVENTMGRTLQENNRGIYCVLNDCTHTMLLQVACKHETSFHVHSDLKILPGECQCLIIECELNQLN